MTMPPRLVILLYIIWFVSNPRCDVKVLPLVRKDVCLMQQLIGRKMHTISHHLTHPSGHETPPELKQRLIRSSYFLDFFSLYIYIVIYI